MACVVVASNYAGCDVKPHPLPGCFQHRDLGVSEPTPAGCNPLKVPALPVFAAATSAAAVKPKPAAVTTAELEDDLERLGFDHSKFFFTK